MGGKSREARQRFEREALPLMDVLYAGALKLTRNASDAEDLVQDTFVRAYERFHLYQPGTNLKAWMFRVMTNHFINIYRRRRKRPDGVSMEGVPEPEVSPVGASLRDYRAAGTLAGLFKDEAFLESLDGRLKKALEDLPLAYRDVLIMFVFGEMAYQEIADILSIPIGTVMSRLSRARALLREQVIELGREEIPGVASG
jgi:RNA polymerase sigma-70 factor, ECF subfamily